MGFNQEYCEYSIHEKKEEKRKPGKNKRGQDNIPILMTQIVKGKKRTINPPPKKKKPNKLNIQ